MYKQLYGWDNLWLAHRKAARGKRGKPATAAFEFKLADDMSRAKLVG